MKKISIIAAALVGLFVVACAPDHSTGITNPLVKIEISGLNSEYKTMYYEQFQITPTVTVSDPEAELSYVWYLSSPTTWGAADTLSREKNLDILFIPEYAQTGIDYTLSFKVTDNDSGVFYRETAAFNVSTQLTKGHLILCQRDGESYLDFLSTYDVENPELIQNTYRNANEGLTLGSNAKRVMALDPDPNWSYIMNEVVVTRDDEFGSLFLEASSFSERREADAAIEYDTDAVKYIADYYRSTFVDYVVVNKQVCRRAINMGRISWETPLVCLKGETSYEAVGPAIPIKTYSGAFYDQLHGRVLTHNPFNYGYLSTLGNTSNDTKPFDINNMDTKLEYICAGKYSSADNNYFLLMRHTETKNYWVYKFSINSTTSAVEADEAVEITAAKSANIANANDFAVYDEASYNGIIFFTTEDGIFIYNVVSHAEAQLTSSADNGFKFSGLEVDMYDIETMEGTETKHNYYEQIRAYVTDPSLSGYQGGYAVYNISTTGGISATYDSDLVGFCDYVIDLDQKFN